MHLLVWRSQPGAGLIYAGSALLAGLVFGLCMAAHFHYGFKKNKLTPWENLSAQKEDQTDTAMSS